MTLNLELNRLAIHYVDRSSPGPIYAPREQNIAALHPTIVGFLLSLVSVVWNALDTGTTRSGRFVPDDHERLGPSVVKRCIHTILRGDAGFFDTSRDLAQHLYRQSPGTASPGLLAITRVVRPDDGAIFVALLKIRHKDESFVRVLGEALTQLEVEQVENMLLREVQKGAIIPHPYKTEYDLKVVDKQATDDPAKYFTENFLACLTKKSDVHQIKKLLPALQRFGRDRELPVATEKLPQVVAALQERNTDVTTTVLAEVVREQEVFGPGLQPDDFVTYIEQQSDVGPVDIPRVRFARRGKRAEKPRRLTYRFLEPDLRGVTLTGPPETLASILSVDGDVFTFRIQTTRDGVSVDYE
jgi:hypothetical protein